MYISKAYRGVKTEIDDLRKISHYNTDSEDDTNGFGTCLLHGEGMYLYSCKESADKYVKEPGCVYEVEIPQSDRMCIIERWNRDGILKYIDFRNSADNNEHKYVGMILPQDGFLAFDDDFFDIIINHYNKADEIEQCVDNMSKLIEDGYINCEHDKYDKYSSLHESAEKGHYEILLIDQDYINTLTYRKVD